MLKFNDCLLDLNKIFMISIKNSLLDMSILKQSSKAKLCELSLNVFELTIYFSLY